MSDRLYIACVVLLWMILVGTQAYDMGWRRGFNSARDIYRRR